jgi:hypothetical protein
MASWSWCYCQNSTFPNGATDVHFLGSATFERERWCLDISWRHRGGFPTQIVRDSQGMWVLLWSSLYCCWSLTKTGNASTNCCIPPPPPTHTQYKLKLQSGQRYSSFNVQTDRPEVTPWHVKLCPQRNGNRFGHSTSPGNTRFTAELPITKPWKVHTYPSTGSRNEEMKTGVSHAVIGGQIMSWDSRTSAGQYDQL